MKLKAIIIDDEQHCIDTLTYDLEKYCAEYVTILDTGKNAIEATSLINKHQPDLLFLDIELPGINGMDFLSQIGPINCAVIFTTAYGKYAREGYKYEAAGYLLKPIDHEELKEVVERVSNGKQSSKVFQSRLAVTDNQGVEFIAHAQIKLCEASNNYTSIYLSDGSKKVVSKTLKAIESQLPNEQFIRIHQSFIINISFIKKFLKVDGGTIELTDGTTYSLSKKYKDRFTQLYL